MMKNETDENVIGIFALRTRAGLLENFFGVVAEAARSPVELADLRGQSRRIFRGGDRVHRVTFAREDIVELRL